MNSLVPTVCHRFPLLTSHPVHQFSSNSAHAYPTFLTHVFFTSPHGLMSGSIFIYTSQTSHHFYSVSHPHFHFVFFIFVIFYFVIYLLFYFYFVIFLLFYFYFVIFLLFYFYFVIFYFVIFVIPLPAPFPLRLLLWSFLRFLFLRFLLLNLSWIFMCEISSPLSQSRTQHFCSFAVWPVPILLVPRVHKSSFLGVGLSNI